MCHTACSCCINYYFFYSHELLQLPHNMERLHLAVTSRSESLQVLVHFCYEGPAPAADLHNALPRCTDAAAPPAVVLSWPHHLAASHLAPSELPLGHSYPRKHESPLTSSTDYLKVSGLQFLHLREFFLRLEPAPLIFIGHGRGSHSGGKELRCQKAPSGTRPLTVNDVALQDWPVDSTLVCSPTSVHVSSDGGETLARMRMKHGV